MAMKSHRHNWTFSQYKTVIVGFFNIQRVDLKIYNFRFAISLIKNLSWEAIGDYRFSLTHETRTWRFAFAGHFYCPILAIAREAQI